MPTGVFVGLTTLDVIQLVDGPPAPNCKATAQQSWLAAGGPAAVAAITFAALGGDARLVTALGEGAAADVARADLLGAGVEVVDAAPAGYGIAASVALVDANTGERSVISGSGHRPSGLRAPFDLAAADVVLLDGHHPELALAAADAASARLPVVVDAGSHKPVFDQLWPLVTDVICSADYVDPAGVAPKSLLEHGLRLVAVSHGADPLEWWTAQAAGRLLVPQVAAVDTLGAGDVLHGAYAFALASGSGRPTALQFAIEAAAERVTTLGPFRWRSEIAGRLWQRWPWNRPGLIIE